MAENDITTTNESDGVEMNVGIGVNVKSDGVEASAAAMNKLEKAVESTEDAVEDLVTSFMKLNDIAPKLEPLFRAIKEVGDDLKMGQGEGGKINDSDLSYFQSSLISNKKDLDTIIGKVEYLKSVIRDVYATLKQKPAPFTPYDLYGSTLDKVKRFDANPDDTTRQQRERTEALAKQSEESEKSYQEARDNIALTIANVTKLTDTVKRIGDIFKVGSGADGKVIGKDISNAEAVFSTFGKENMAAVTDYPKLFETMLRDAIPEMQAKSSKGDPFRLSSAIRKTVSAMVDYAMAEEKQRLEDIATAAWAQSRDADEKRFKQRKEQSRDTYKTLSAEHAMGTGFFDNGKNNNLNDDAYEAGKDAGESFDKGLSDALKDATMTRDQVDNINLVRILMNQNESLPDAHIGEQISASIADDLDEVSNEIETKVASLQERLSGIMSSLTDSAVHTTDTELMSGIATDTKNTETEVQELINKLVELKSSLKQSAEVTDLVKQAEKYKAAWEQALEKRTDFVANKNTTILNQYDNYQRRIEEQEAVAKALNAKMQPLKDKGFTPENNKELERYTEQLEVAARSIRSFKKSQQELLQKGDASLMSTYVSYTTKMTRNAENFANVINAIQDAESFGRASNADEVKDQYNKIIPQIVGKLDSLEGMAEKAGQTVGEAYNKGLTDAMKDATVDANLINSRNNLTLMMDRNEVLPDASFASDMSASIAGSINDVVNNISSSVTELSSKLSSAMTSIPDSIISTDYGNMVNSVAVDAKNAGAEVHGLIDELVKLKSSLSQSTEMKDLIKQAEKYKAAWKQASSKRDAFVANTNETVLNKYDNFERQIEQQQAIANELNSKLGPLKNLGLTAKDNEDVAKYEQQLDKVTRKIESLKNSQQTLAQNRSDASMMSTYVTYTSKMLDNAEKYAETIRKIQELEASGGASNVEEINAKYQELIHNITKGVTEVKKASSTASAEALTLKHNVSSVTQVYQGLKTPNGFMKTDILKEREKQARAAYKTIQTLTEKQDKYIQNGTKVDSKAWKNLQIELANANKEYKEQLKLIDEIVAKNQAFEIKKSGFNHTFGDFLAKNSLPNIDWMSTLSSVWKSGSGAFTGTLKKEYSFIRGIIKNIASLTSLWGKNQKSVGDSAKQMYKTFTSYMSMLRTRVRRKIVSVMFEDLQENLRKVAEISPRFNEAVSDFIVSSKTVGAQIIAAFEPLVSNALPYVTAFVDYLLYASQQMSQFISQLFGEDTWIKAVKGQFDFAKSLDKTTSSTNKAKKAAKEYENTVLSFDQLHKLNGKKNSSDDSDSLFEASKYKNGPVVPNKLIDIAKAIHDAITAGDWYSAGKAMAQGVNEAFKWLNDVAGWTTNGEKFTAWISHAIDLINGFIDGIDSVGNGQAIGNVLNSLINLADRLTDPEVGVHFYEAGRMLGETFTAALLEIDWDKAGRAFVNGLQGLAKMVTGFITADVAYNGEEMRKINYDDNGVARFEDGTVVDPNEWDIVKGSTALGLGLKEMFSSAIDTFNADTWSDLFSSLFNSFFDFIGNLFSDPEKSREFGKKIGDMIAGTIKKLDPETVSTGINNFAASMNEAIEGLFDSDEWGEALENLKDIFVGIDWWGEVGELIGKTMFPAILTGIVAAATTGVKIAGGALVAKAILDWIMGSTAASAGVAGAATGTATSAGIVGTFTVIGETAFITAVCEVLAAKLTDIGLDIVGTIQNALGFDGEWNMKFGERADDPITALRGTGYQLVGTAGYHWSKIFDFFGLDWLSDKAFSLTEWGANGLQGLADHVNGTSDESIEKQDNLLTDHFGTDGEALLTSATEHISTALPATDGSVLASANTENFMKDVATEITKGITEAFASGSDPNVIVKFDSQEVARIAMKGMRQINKTHNPLLAI